MTSTINFKFSPIMFNSIQRELQTTCTVDTCADDCGHSALCHPYYSPSRSFLNSDCSGQVVWLNPPAARADRFVRHYLACKQRLPGHTSAVIVIYRTNKLPSIDHLLGGMRHVKRINAGTPCLQTLDMNGVPIGERSLPHPIDIYYDAPAVEQLDTIDAQQGMFLQGITENMPCTLMLDNGATGCYADMVFVKTRKLPFSERNTTVQVAGGQSIQALGYTTFQVKIQGTTHRIRATVLPSLMPNVHVILGNSWITEQGAILDYNDHRCILARYKGGRKVLEPVSTPPQAEYSLTTDEVVKYCAAILESQSCPKAISARRAAYMIRQPDTRCMLVQLRHDNIDVTGRTELTDQTSSVDTCVHGGNEVELVPEHLMQQLYDEFADTIVDDLEGVGPDLPVPHTIPTPPGAPTPFRPMYRISPREYDEMSKQIADLLKKGFIVPSTSPYGAPILFVGKKDGTLRMVIDYRALNKITIKNRYPLPRIDMMLDRMHGYKIFSTLDLCSGYHQIKLHPDDAHKTAFRTPLGHYQFTVLPFGLANAPATFQGLMNTILAHLRHCSQVYLDDICVMSKTAEEHIQHLREVLTTLRQHGLKCKRKKCHFNLHEVNYLGFIVGKNGIKADPAKIDAIRKWPRPTEIQHVRQFLGTTNYFRKFILAYASIARSLQILLNANMKFVWGPAQEQAFQALKDALVNAPLLLLPDMTKPFEVISDASLHGTGAVLIQDGHPVAYTSKGFTPAERNYHTTDQECLGVVRALKEWRCYLEGADVTLVTDHNPLVHLQTQPNLNRRQARYVEYMARFEPGLKWEYRPGRTNVADGISRVPDRILGITEEQYLNDKNVLTRIREGYKADIWFDDKTNLANMTKKNELYMLGDCIVVPDVDTLRDDIIRMFHAPVHAGHGGISKTYKAVSLRFWWKAMRIQVRKFVRSCDLCQRNKPTNQKQAGTLEPLEIPDRCWETVTMDYMTHLPKTDDGYDAILVFVDKFSKMAVFAPTTTDVTAEQTIELLNQKVIGDHGWPRKLITDRDARFIGEVFQNWCKENKVHHAASSAYHPQTDGQTERMNRILEETLRHYVDKDHKNWARLLPFAQYAINNSYQSSIQNTPFFLNYGQHPLQPESQELEDNNPTRRVKGTEWQAIIKRTKQCLHAAAQRQKAEADKHRRDVSYKPGDFVLLSTRNLNIQAVGTPKFMPVWIGPFKVIDMVGRVAVKLDLKDNQQGVNYRFHPVVHVSRVKEYIKTDTTDKPPPPLTVDSDGAGIWVVDKILNHKINRRGRKHTYQYLVSWKGWPVENNSWIPAENFVDQQCIDDYWSNVPGGKPGLPTHRNKKPKSLRQLETTPTTPLEAWVQRTRRRDT